MTRQRILIVDDQPELRRLMALTLATGDFDVLEAESGPEALHKARTARPQVMLLDIMMPGEMDGLQVCETIKRDPELKRIRIYLISARAQKADLEAGKKAGADGYLTKPFSPLELLEILDKEKT